MPADQLDWVVRDVGRCGELTQLASFPQVGKSTLVGAMLSSATKGEPFAGLDAASSGALWLTEEPEQVVGERRDRFELGDETHFSFRHEWPADMPWPEKVRHAVGYCQEHGLDTLVVDTVSRWAGLAESQENDAGAVMAALEPLESAARGDGLCVIALWHHRKSEGERGERVRGSSASVGCVDILVELENASDRARTLKVLGRHGEAEYVVELRGDEYVSSTPGKAQARSAFRRIFDVLEHQPATAEELAESLGLSHGTVAGYLRRAWKAGRLARRRDRDVVGSRPYLYWVPGTTPGMSEAGELREH